MEEGGRGSQELQAAGVPQRFNFSFFFCCFFELFLGGISKGFFSDFMASGGSGEVNLGVTFGDMFEKCAFF